MEAALRSVLQNTLGEYVDGLQNASATFPLTLQNLKLKEKKVNEELGESDVPFDVTDGTIGRVTIKPGWLGDLEVIATDIVLHMAFNPMKVMKRMNAPQEETEEYYYETVPSPVAAPPPPPRFCYNHDSSDKRQKCQPCERQCQSCGVMLQTSYTDFTLCPHCSERHQSCLICGKPAPKAGNYIPARSIDQQGPVPPTPCSGQPTGMPPAKGGDFPRTTSRAPGAAAPPLQQQQQGLLSLQNPQDAWTAPQTYLPPAHQELPPPPPPAPVPSGPRRYGDPRGATGTTQASGGNFLGIFAFG